MQKQIGLIRPRINQFTTHACPSALNDGAKPCPLCLGDIINRIDAAVVQRDDRLAVHAYEPMYFNSVFAPILGRRRVSAPSNALEKQVDGQQDQGYQPEPTNEIHGSHLQMTVFLKP
ncbi:hypothetical protein NK8_63560 (plasmid) [Caballeronia sp. NK8]|nr:hypothetical protein NK8_63560 [Caballeronia sp. NK8]